VCLLLIWLILSVWDDIRINHFNKRRINVNFIAILVFVTIVRPRFLPSLCVSHITDGGLTVVDSISPSELQEKRFAFSWHIIVPFLLYLFSCTVCYALSYEKVQAGNCRPWFSLKNDTVQVDTSGKFLQHDSLQILHLQIYCWLKEPVHVTSCQRNSWCILSAYFISRYTSPRCNWFPVQSWSVPDSVITTNYYQM
jgi:hypothetical protein